MLVHRSFLLIVTAQAPWHWKLYSVNTPMITCFPQSMMKMTHHCSFIIGQNKPIATPLQVQHLFSSTSEHQLSQWWRLRLASNRLTQILFLILADWFSECYVIFHLRFLPYLQIFPICAFFIISTGFTHVNAQPTNKTRKLMLPGFLLSAFIQYFLDLCKDQL